MSDPNAAQRDFWTSGSGPDWVTWQEALDLAFAPALEALLDAADLRPGACALDVGCGTGTSTIEAARRVGPEGKVIGADISETLLGAARKTGDDLSNRDGHGEIVFTLTDVQTDPLPRADALISRFGMMFFADPVAAFRNIAAHLAPASPLTFVCWGGMPVNTWFRIPFEAATERLGPVARTDPYAPGPTAFKDTDRVVDLMRAAGLDDPAARELDLDLTPGGGISDVARLLLKFGPAGRAMLEKNGTEADALAIERAIADRLTDHQTPRGIRLPARINLFTARTPA